VQDAELAQEHKQQPILSSQQPEARHPAAADAKEPSEQQTERQQHADGKWLPLVSNAYSWVKHQLRIQPSRHHDAAISAIAGPALLSLAADPLLSLVDTAFVGRLGPAELVRGCLVLDVCMAHCETLLPKLTNMCMRISGSNVSIVQGALGVNTSLFAFSFVVCNFLSNATTPLVARALSSGNKRQVGERPVRCSLRVCCIGLTIDAISR
jgi:Na+-driven multidrug efflux pump